MVMIQSDIRSALQIASPLGYLKPNHRLVSRRVATFRPPPRLAVAAGAKVRAFSTHDTETEGPAVEKVSHKPPVCTADELHYVSVPNSDWRLALWRYTPPPQAPPRNHPLLLLSGVATNAIGFDLSPGSSFARYMCGQGFDTWILEVRGAGLSMQGSDLKQIEQNAHTISEHMEATAEAATDRVFPAEQQSTNIFSTLSESYNSVAKGNPAGMATVWDESKLVTKLTETFIRLSERLSGFLNERQSQIVSAKFFDQISRLLEDSFPSERFDEIRGKLSSLLEARQNSAVASQIRELSQKLVNIVEESQRSVSPQLYNLQERLFTTIEDFQKQLDLIIKYDWDFDHYLEEDIPAAMEYVRGQCKPKDGKLFAVGHSMGAFEGRDPGLAAVGTLGSSLDYTSSNSSLKVLLPLADPAQALNVPVVPFGALLAAAYPLSSRPPYALSWLNHLISAEDMMHPELLRKLVLNNFFKERKLVLNNYCTVPAKLILQLRTAFRDGGLSNRTGTFFFKEYLHKSEVPVLAIAADQDLICPPEAVYGKLPSS
ncbi:hypothetical protein RHGRI_026835 [Rhododendron griersonianum]|uniref:AB hydrolase-1 domain-containing protein n=1 Tax=Rhododendron griersonianum TaxID=479676 RepID=A0AAV6IXR6_9ERIC|nr:hypothetical protein RHGRI_026835 [Rhododendron griersonianum]